ncbi:MAG: hypothetical protein DMF59_10310 [Acidobacteria bacterium]|nr:MAG: hypothetical protein DMF59_10310 [Acidobacteriota bacterium]
MRMELPLDSANNAFIAGGVTSNLDFVPLINPIAGVTGQSLFLTKLNSAGSNADYSTYIDGHFNLPIGVAIDPNGAVYVAGTSFPAQLNTDAFVIKVITNRAPIANAGLDQSVSVGSSFVLDGGASSDPDGDPLTYVWKDGSNAVVGTTSTVTLTRPQGVHTFTLTVSDGKSTASDTVDISVYTTLNVNLFGLVSGRVTSNDGKIDCTATGSPGCFARYNTATPVALTATPGTGVSFTGWIFDCSGSGNCSVNMSANHLIGAQFAVQQLTLSVSSPANGKVKSSSGIDCGSSCSLVVPYGTIVTLSTEADSGYQFDMWSGNCAGTTTPTCSVTMDANKAVGVAFKEIALNALSVAPASATIAVGQQQQFIASGTFSDGSVRALSGDHSVEGTDDFTCAITTTGAVKCWGRAPYQTLTTRVGYEKAVMLSAGTSHICALFANGTVTCDGGPMVGVTTAVAVASESGTPCALLTDGSIRCGGVVGPLATVTGITNAVAIGAEGGGGACAVLADGTVSCWFGLGDGSSPGSGSTLPQQIAGINNAVAVAVGAEHACALLSDGTVKCFWRNNRGQLGDGSAFNANSFSSTPVTVINVTGAISIVTGDYHTCALLSNGTVKCWGMQYANGLTVDSSTPATISGLSNPAAIAAGAFHNCASFSNGTVKCWGLNNVGQLGMSNPSFSVTPLPASSLSKVSTMSWSSSDTGTRMMASGRAIADAAGTPMITATAGSLNATASLTVLNTPPGTNVVTKPIDSATGGTPATITFASVTTAGSTSVTSSGSGSTPPAGFQTTNPQRYYNITTTATYIAPITICISYAGSLSSFPPQLFHFEGGVWKDVTTSIDTIHEIVCGEVSSLSPFALFVRLVNHPPIADAGADQAAECGTRVTLDGSHSSDPDHDRLTYVWTGSFGRIEGRMVSVFLPAGANVVTLTVSDGFTTASDTVAVTISDTVAPAIRTVTATPSVLWPPNHKMIPVTVTVAASDICDPAVRCRIVEVTSNEPDDEAWKIDGDLTVQLKAERSGNGNGRLYTITIRCTDASGNPSSKTTVTVTVPRSAP